MKLCTRPVTMLGIFCLAWLMLSILSPLPAFAETTDPAGLPDDAPGERISDSDRQGEREKRMILRTIDDLGALLSITAREMAELERETDSVALLEPSARKTDLRDLIVWYSDYSGWLKVKQTEFDGDLAWISSDREPTDGRWPERYAEIVAGFKGFEKRLRPYVKRYDQEGKRLAQIIDRQRLLQGNAAELGERLAWIEKRLAERPGEKGWEEREAADLRSQIWVVQSELLSLPLVNEDILKHYMNLSERAKGEGEWLLEKSDEYDLLSDIGNIIASNGTGGNAAVEAALGQVRMVYERQIDHLERKIEAIDSKRSRVTPAGSIRDVERSADLDRLYFDQKQRYEEYIKRLKIQLGALEAELSGLL